MNPYCLSRHGRLLLSALGCFLLILDRCSGRAIPSLSRSLAQSSLFSLFTSGKAAEADPDKQYEGICKKAGRRRGGGGGGGGGGL